MNFLYSSLLLQHNECVIDHCIKICEIPRYTALFNSVKCPCNTPFFSVSGLLQERSQNQSGYREIHSVTRTFYSVRQCSISLYFTYLISVFHISYAVYSSLLIQCMYSVNSMSVCS